MNHTPPRWAVMSAVALACLIGGAVAASAATSGSDRASGSLSLDASLALSSMLGACAPPVGADDCGARTIRGPFPGLGQASGAYEFPIDLGGPACTESSGKALAHEIRLAVAGKGEIQVAVAEAECSLAETLYNQTQTFTVTGGTGMYAGATGSGTLERRLGGTTSTGRHGRETWTGTLDVPGIAFDVTQPTLTGAASKTVKARKGVKSARVAFRVSAQDDRDGSLPVTCRPSSGTRFPIGKTKVACSATDSSANAAAATFTVTVKRTR